MNYLELTNLMNEKRKICIWGGGFLGRGDGYLFLKSMLEPRQTVSYFCDNHLDAEVEITDGIKTIGLDYLCSHRNEIVCVIAVEKQDIQQEIKEQLANEGVQMYTLDSCDIFGMCNSILLQDELASKVEKFFKMRKYEFQIETSSFCNARCNFCPNVSLKRDKNIMKSEVFEKIIKRIKEEKINVSKFILCLNGEPLTDPELFSRIRKLKSEFPGVYVEFTSNFSLANEEVIENIFESGLDRIVCSLNSVDASKYEEMMGLKYVTTLKNIKRLLIKKKELSSNLEVCLSIVANPDNIAEVDEFKKIYRDQASIRVMKLGQWIDKKQSKSLFTHSRTGICPILYRTINILSNGEFALCCFDAEGIIDKNIMECTIREAWESSVFAEMRKWHINHGRTNERCLNCSF